MKKWGIIPVICGLLLSVQGGAGASQLVTAGAKALDAAEAELDRLPTDDQQAAAGEIAQARRWIKEGRMLLQEGKIGSTAVLIERLTPQLTLIRLLIATSRAWDETDRVGHELTSAKQKLQQLRVRHNRLMRWLHGGRLTDATAREGSHP